MEYQNFDNMRNTMGYSNMNCPNMCMNMQMPFQNINPSYDALERMYPDTYRIIYPMIVSVCNVATEPFTEEMLDRMTDDIFNRIVADPRINIDMDSETISSANNPSNERTNDPATRNDPMPKRDTRNRNRFFRDFIRILLIRELLGRRPIFPMRSF